MTFYQIFIYVCLDENLCFLCLQILNEIQRNKIRIYEFPDVDDEEENKEMKKLKVSHYNIICNSQKVLVKILTWWLLCFLL